ncbi:MAG: choice-of-anchor D domain-containing protein [Bacteroidota bacterium]
MKKNNAILHIILLLPVISISILTAAQPVITQMRDTTINAGTVFQITVKASDADGDMLVFSAKNLPYGSTFDPETHQLKWTPQSTDTGRYKDVTFIVSDGSASDSTMIVITVIRSANNPPVITQLQDTTISAGTVFQLTINATDTDGDVLVFSAKNLPYGSTFDPETHQLKWTPQSTDTGRYKDVTFIVSDGSASDSTIFAITVLRSANNPPVITQMQDTTIYSGNNIRITINAIDLDGDILFYIAKNLPYGSTFNAESHQFKWSTTILDTGIFKNITFIVTDGINSDSTIVTLTIIPPNRKAVISLSSVSFMFGNIKLGQFVDSTITLSNIGTDTLKITSITSSKSCFSIRPTILTIPPGLTKIDTIRFTSDSIGVRGGKIFITSNDATTPDTISVSGNGVGIPVLVLSRSSIGLGNVVLNTFKKDTITIWNKGSDTLKISNIISTNTQYSAVPTVRSIPPNGSLIDTLKFIPTAIGSSSARILIASNDTTTPDTISVSGFCSGVPILALSRASINVGIVALNTLKNDTMTIYNNGTDTLKITNIASTNMQYTAVPTVRNIPPNGSLIDTLKFIPTAIGTSSAKILITSNDSTTPDTISVSGFCGGVPILILSRRSVDQGKIKVGQTGRDTIVIRNIGTDTLKVSSITASSIIWKISKNVLIVPPNLSVMDTIIFTPSVIGIITGKVVITSNCQTSPDTLTVIGSGVSTTGPVLTFSSTVLDYGTVKLTDKRDTIITISNVGTDTLKITSILSTKSCFTVHPTILTIPPGQGKSDTIRMTADSLGIRSGKIIFSSNDPFGPDTISVNGNGVGIPVLVLSRSSIDLGNVSLNALKWDTVTIWNKGIDTLKISNITSNNTQYSAVPTLRNIPPNGSLVDTIKFIPTTVASSSAKILIASNDATTPDTISLSGNSPQPILTLNQTNFDWQLVNKGKVQTKELRIMNGSINTLDIDSIYTMTKYYMVNKSKGTVLMNETLRVIISFTADTFDIYTDTLYLRNTSVNRLVKIQLKGESPLPVLTLIPTIYRKDTIAVGDSTVQKFVIKNTSVNDLIYQDIRNKSIAFTISGNNSGTVKSQDSISFFIIFKPLTFLEYNDTLMITSMSVQKTYPLTGFSPFPSMTASVSTLDFGNVYKDSTAIKTILVKNNSINKLRIDSLKTLRKQTGAVFTVKSFTAPVFVSKNDSSMFAIIFKPDTIRMFSDTVFIYSNQQNAIIPISLRGVGNSTTSFILSDDIIPKQYSLNQNFPNPFNPTTILRYGLPNNSSVSLKIYNVLGQQVANLVHSEQSAGWQRITWNANVSTGLYFYRLEAVDVNNPNNRFVQVKKMLLLK